MDDGDILQGVFEPEAFDPKYVEAFTWNATLRDSKNEAQNWDGTLEGLGKFTDRNYYLDLPESTHDESVSNFDSISTSQDYENAIYATIVENSDQDKLAIEYWIPYYMSDWANHGGTNTHESDWESIVVYFDTNGPDRVAYSQHKTLFLDFSNYREWTNVETVNLHPVVYSGLGGHASYFVDSDMDGGTTYLNGKTEFHDGNGTVFSPENNLEVYSLPNSRDGWLGEFEWLKYGGHWGQKDWGDPSYSSIWPFSLADDGPRGPAFSDYWENPFRWGYSEINEDIIIDSDGIPMQEESGPDGIDQGYDGNQDGIPDWQEGNVSSFHTVTDDYVTLASPESTMLVNVKAIANPSPNDVPSKVKKMPYGCFEFAIDGVGTGGSVSTTLILPGPVNSYYKYGPTPNNPTDHWYKFKYDGQTGAEINGNIVTLHFVDGQRGDNDITANGTVVEPGGPAIVNEAPQITSLNLDSTTIDENETITLSGSFTDWNTLDTHTALIDWGDGQSFPATVDPSVNTLTASHQYLDDTLDGYTISVELTDNDGEQDTASTSVVVLNVAPVVDSGADQTVNEGDVVNFSGSFTDPGSADTHTIDWDFGDSTGAVGTLTQSHIYADNGIYTVTLTVTDDDGGSTSDTLTVTVNNVAPTIALSGLAVFEEGSTYILTLGLVNDPGEDTVTEYIVHWGDGTLDTYISGGDVTHVYADGPADHAIVVDLVDEDGTHPGSATLDVQVTNIAPSLAGATFEVEENSANGTMVGMISGSDPGNDTLTYSVIGGSGVTAFAIDATTGRIIIADATQLDYETTPSFTLEVQVTDDDNAADTATVTINLLNQASITGTVFVDVNENGVYEANEPGIEGITIELLDENGAPILDTQNNPVTAIASDGDFYLFEDLNPGTYLLYEVQPTGVDDGEEILGSLGGTIPVNDTMRLTLERIDATDYIFAELGQVVASGDTATIGFWQNKHGQELIIQGGTALADWLTSNFGNVFGDTFIGGDGDDVASFYRDQLFRQKSKKSAGPAKADAQFMAVALATYFTSSNLAGNVAAGYGFNITDTGLGTKVVNVGDNGTAFGVASGSDLTIMQLLLATNDLTDQPDNLIGFARIYDWNGDGEIDNSEAALRTLANDVFSTINELGDI